MKKYKNYSEKNILDNIGSEELAANLFRITQIESKLKRDNITSENEANNNHYNIRKKHKKSYCQKWRNNVKKLPTPRKSLK